jgi:hypothetical protein
MINSWINTSYKFLIVTEFTLTQSQSQIQTQIHPNSLKFLQTFLQLFPSNLDSSCRFSIPIINSCTIEDLLKAKSGRTLLNHHCWTWSIFMADANSGSLKHDWAKASLPYIFPITIEQLFCTFKLRIQQIQQLHLHKVGIRNSQFMKLGYGFDRS